MEAHPFQHGSFASLLSAWGHSLPVLQWLDLCCHSPLAQIFTGKISALLFLCLLVTCSPVQLFSRKIRVLLFLSHLMICLPAQVITVYFCLLFSVQAASATSTYSTIITRGLHPHLAVVWIFSNRLVECKSISRLLYNQPAYSWLEICPFPAEHTTFRSMYGQL